MNQVGSIEALEEAIVKHELFVEGIKIYRGYCGEPRFEVRVGFFYGEHGRGTATVGSPIEFGLQRTIADAIEAALHAQKRDTNEQPGD